MFEASLADMKLAPALRSDEQAVFGAVGRVASAWFDVAVVVTNQRLIVRPRKGYSVDPEHRDRASLEWDLEDIESVRLETGLGPASVEVEVNGQRTELPWMHHGNAKKVAGSIVRVAGLRPSEWTEEGGAQKAGRGLVGGVLSGLGIIGAVIGAILGIAMILAGILLSLTIFGAILGVPLILLGVFVLAGSGVFGAGGAKAASWGFGQAKEWVQAEEAPPSDSQVDNRVSATETKDKPQKAVSAPTAKHYRRTLWLVAAAYALVVLGFAVGAVWEVMGTQTGEQVLTAGASLIALGFFPYVGSLVTMYQDLSHLEGRLEGVRSLWWIVGAVFIHPIVAGIYLWQRRQLPGAEEEEEGAWPVVEEE